MDSLDPVVQANINKLVGALEAKQAELESILASARTAVGELKTVATEQIAVQQEQARTLSAQRPPGAGTIEDTTAAVRQLAAAERQVNAAITRQIELRTQALAAARGQVGAAGETAAAGGLPGGLPPIVNTAAGGGGGGGGEGQSLEEQLRALKKTGVGFQTAGSIQRVLNAIGAGGGGEAGGGGAGGAGEARQKAADATAKLSKEEERLYVRAMAAADGESAIGKSLQYNILASAQLDNEMQRHGAMTSEFIAAAARGQVTLKEFGSQILQTVGKFAGWTVAAGAVYGVIGSVTELAHGAIDGANAVDQLHRTINGLDSAKATTALVDLAHETNTSMKEAGDAVFQFSRTFPNLDDAIYTSRLALMAYALDGVQVADTVKMVTALHQQFGIEAQSMGPIFDQLAMGQREFNARMTDQIPLLQRSASAVKNAGGDLQDFIELSTVALRTTQLSGSQLGTFFARSAANFLSPTTSKGKADRAVLAALGIDPNQDYTTVLADAIKRSATLSDDQRRQLAAAVGGPQLGARAAGLFSGGAAALLPVVHQQRIDQAAHPGTFLEEFTKYLASPRQELKALVNDVQQLGAAMANSGLLVPLGLLVKLLDETLHLTTEILGVWDRLPTPIHDAAAAMLAVVAAQRVAGHFNLNIPGIGPSSEQRAQKQMEVGLKDESAVYAAQLASARAGAVSAGFAVRAGEARVAATRAVVEEERAASAEGEVSVATAKKLAAEQAALERSQAEMVAYENQALGYQEEINAQLARNNAIRADIAAGMSVEGALIKGGVYATPTTLAKGKFIPGGIATLGEEATIGAATQGAAAATAAGGVAAQETRQIGLWTAAKARFATQVAAENEALAASTTGAEAETAAMAANAEAETAAAARVPLTTAAVNSARAGGGLLMGNLGTLTMGLMGSVIVYQALSDAYQGLVDAQHQVDQAIKNVGTGKPGALEDLANKEHKLAQQQSDYLVKIATAAHDVANTLETGLSDAIKLLTGPSGADKAAKAPTQKAEDWKKALSDARTKAGQSGWVQGAVGGIGLLGPLGALPGGIAGALFGGPDAGGLHELASRAEGASNVAFASLKKQADIAAALDTGSGPTQQRFFQALEWVKKAATRNPAFQTLEAINPQEAARVLKGFDNQIWSIYYQREQALKVIAPAASNDPFAAFRGLSLSTLTGNLQALADGIKVFGASNAQWNTVADLTVFIAGQMHSGSSDADIKNVLSAFDTYRQAVSDDVNKKIAEAEAIQIPTVAAAGAAARASALRQRSALLGAAEKELKGRIGQLAQAGMDFAGQVGYSAAGFALAQDALGFVNAAVNAGMADTIYALTKTPAFAGGKPQVWGLWSVLQKALRNFVGQLQGDKAVIGMLGQMNADFQQQLNSILHGQQSDTNKLATPAGAGGADPFEIARLQSEVAKAQADGDPVAQAAADQRFAQIEMSAAKNQKERLQAQLDLITADNAWNKAVEDRTQSFYTYLESTTRDPVKDAVIALRAATEAVSFAVAHGGTGTQGYYEAKAKQNDAKNKLADAHLQVAEDNIQFGLDLNQISTETALLEYENLLKLHNLTLQQRQDLLRKIDALKKGTSADFSALDLGTIRLPTPYEIRRGLLAAQGGTTITQTFTITNHIESGIDASAVGVVIERASAGGFSRARARAIGRG